MAHCASFAKALRGSGGDGGAALTSSSERLFSATISSLGGGGGGEGSGTLDSRLDRVSEASISREAELWSLLSRTGSVGRGGLLGKWEDNGAFEELVSAIMRGELLNMVKSVAPGDLYRQPASPSPEPKTMLLLCCGCDKSSGT